MPVRLKDQYRTAPFSLGSVAQTLADYAPNFDGTVSASPAFEGTIASDAAPYTSAFTGVFDADPSRTGTIAVTMDPHTAEFGGGDPYDLSGVTNLNWTPVWATPPVTDHTTVVTNRAEFAAAVADSNVLITIGDGVTITGAAVTWSGSNIDVVCSNTANINIDMTIAGPQFIRWTGGNISPATGTGLLFRPPSAHMLFDDINFYGRCLWQGGSGDCPSFNVINSTFDGDPVTDYGTDGVCLWTVGNSQVSRGYDWIFANVKFEGRSGNFKTRWHNQTRMLIYECAAGIDTSFVNGPSSLRFGAEYAFGTCDNVHVEDTIMADRIFMSLTPSDPNPPNQQGTNMRFENVSKWTLGQGNAVTWATHNGTNPDSTGVVNRCHTYHNSSIGSPFSLGHAFTTEDGNTVIEDMAITPLPDASGYGAQRP